MKRIATFVLLAALPLVGGCSNQKAEPPATAAPAPAETTAAAPPAAVLLAKSLYDDGPRADSAPVDAAMAAAGEKLFTSKGCTACHTYGKKMLGPDLKGVTARRTATWMEHQIMSPDVMTRTDPISHGLMAENKNLQMLNMHLTQAEAQSLVEYLKKLDRAK